MDHLNPIGGNSTSETLGSAIDGAESRTHAAIDSAADGVAHGADVAADAAHDAVDDLATNARFASYKAGDAIDDVIDRGNGLADVITDRIRENPIMAAGAALAIGYLIARLSR